MPAIIPNSPRADAGGARRVHGRRDFAIEALPHRLARYTALTQQRLAPRRVRDIAAKVQVLVLKDVVDPLCQRAAAGGLRGLERVGAVAEIDAAAGPVVDGGGAREVFQWDLAGLERREDTVAARLYEVGRKLHLDAHRHGTVDRHVGRVRDVDAVVRDALLRIRKPEDQVAAEERELLDGDARAAHANGRCRIGGGVEPVCLDLIMQ